MLLINSDKKNHFIIFSVLLFAILLPFSTMSFSRTLNYILPSLTTLSLLNFILKTPGNSSMFFVIFLSILFDVLYGTPLGSHAAAMTIASFIILKFRLRTGLFSLLQHSIIAASFVLTLLMPRLFSHLTSYGGVKMSLPLLFISPVISALIWKWFSDIADKAFIRIFK